MPVDFDGIDPCLELAVHAILCEKTRALPKVSALPIVQRRADRNNF